MIGRQIIVYFMVFVITNFIAIFFSSKILDGIYAKFFKLLLFSLFFTIIQLVLEQIQTDVNREITTAKQNAANIGLDAEKIDEIMMNHYDIPEMKCCSLCPRKCILG